MNMADVLELVWEICMALVFATALWLTWIGGRGQR